MYCKKCGQQLEDGSNFCPTCGTNQNETVTQSSEQTIPQPQVIYELKPKKPLKKPSTSVILNLIAVFIVFFFNEIFFGVLCLDSTFCGSLLLNIGVLLPLAFSVVVMFVKNNAVKMLSSVAELIISIILLIYLFENEVFYLLEGNILIIIAAFFNLSYSKKVKYYPQVPDENIKKKNVLGLISAVLVVVVMILSVAVVNPYAKFNKQFSAIEESDKLTAEDMGKISEFREDERFTDEVNKRVYERAKKEVGDEHFNDAITWCNLTEGYKKTDEIIIWCKIQGFYQRDLNTAVALLKVQLKYPDSYLQISNKYSLNVQQFNTDEVKINGKIHIVYSATNSFGGRLQDSYVYNCTEKRMPSYGRTPVEISEIGSLSKTELLNLYK